MQTIQSSVIKERERNKSKELCWQSFDANLYPDPAFYFDEGPDPYIKLGKIHTWQSVQLGLKQNI